MFDELVKINKIIIKSQGINRVNVDYYKENQLINTMTESITTGTTKEITVPNIECDRVEFTFNAVEQALLSECGVYGSYN